MTADPSGPSLMPDQLLASVGITSPRTTSPSASDPEGWDGPPVPLGAHRMLPPFPVDALPGWVADYVGAVAEATQTPADLPGCIALACLSTASGGRAVVVPRPGWTEPVNIYTAVALPPGSRKSSVFRALTQPLGDAEQKLIEQNAGERRQALLDKRVAEAKAESAAKAAETAKSDPTAAMAEAEAAQGLADDINIPVQPRLFADDITPEAAASLLAEQNGRLAVLSAEGGVFNTLAGRYSSTPNLEVFLKGHAGDLLRVDRRGRPPEHIEQPALTLGVALQPQVLTDLAGMAQFRSRGLLARVLYALPENTVGHRKIGTPPPDEAATDAWSDRLQELVLSLSGNPEPLELRLTNDAAHALHTLEEWLEPRLNPQGGDLATITDWASKLTGAVLRLAGLLHLADRLQTGHDQPLDAETFEQASRIGHYYLAHALAVFDLMGADPDIDDARHLLTWINRTAPQEFSRRDAFYALRSQRFTKVTDLDPALTLLIEHGYIRNKTTETSSKGGRPSIKYEVHPQVTEPTQPTNHQVL